MGSYRIFWKKSVERDLRKIDRQWIPRILEAIESLAENPFPPHCRKLRGAENFYRIRVGDYRVIYMVDTDEKIIVIFYVRHQSEAYKGL